MNTKAYIITSPCRLLLTVITIVMISFFSRGETPEFKDPDFAYPQDVIKNAQELLEHASRSQSMESYVERLRALEEINAAKIAVDPDAAFEMPAQVEAVVSQCPSDKGDAAAMLLLFQANIYKNIYNSDRWKYDNVDSPKEPLPASVAQWSGLQFRSKIQQLLDKAIALAGETPLETFKQTLTYSDEVLQYVPTVKAFAMSFAYDVLTNFSDDEYRVAAKAIRGHAMDMYNSRTAPYYFWFCKDADSREMLKVYEADSEIEPARYVLMEWLDKPVEIEDDGIERDVSASSLSENELKQISLLEGSLRLFPGWYGNNFFKNRLNELRRAVLRFSVPQAAAPGQPIEIKASYSYLRNGNIKVYALPANISDYRVNSIEKYPCVKEFSLSSQNPESGTRNFSLVLDRPGKYALVAYVDGQKNNYGAPVLTISPLAPVVVSGLNRHYAFATAFQDGKPLPGVGVTLKSSSWRKNDQVTSKNLGRTDGNGMLEFSLPAEKDYVIAMNYNGLAYDFDKNVYVYNVKESEQPAFDQALIFTDRSLYHPGDSLEWAVVLGHTDKSGGKTLSASVTVKLFDANSQECGFIETATDAMGRANGVFATPKTGLTGRFALKAFLDKKEIGTRWVEVSDFRLPTFNAVVTGIERNIPEEGGVRITGIAKTYSGMPVSGAKVEAKIFGATRWRWFAPQKQLGILDATTDAQGSFVIDVPASLLVSGNINGRPYTDFMADITVTSLAAETAQVSKPFTTGKPYSFSVKFASNCLDTSVPVNFKVDAYNADGNPNTVAYLWEIFESKDIKSIVATGKGVAGAPVVADLANLAAGEYGIRIIPADNELADSLVERNCVTFYNVAKNLVPEINNSVLFCPKDSYILEQGKTTANILIGVTVPQAYVYEIVSRRGDIISVRLRTLNKGFHEFKFDDSDDLRVDYLAVSNGNANVCTIVINHKKNAPLAIKAETFRDRLIPGDTETWRFRILDGNSAPLADAAMIATMYNKALDALYSGNYPEGFRSSYSWYTPGVRLSFRSFSFAGDATFGKLDLLSAPDLLWPVFKFGDVLTQNRIMYSFKSSMSNVRVRGSAKMTLADAVTEEEMENVPSESAGASDFASDNADNGNMENPRTDDYRVGEVLQAFFKPDLVSDSQGNIDICFTVPNANGSWTFKAFAWTAALEAAGYDAQAVANKPIMVQPNLPRFLRQGDKANVIATVFNNSDKEQVVATTVEVFDINNGNVYCNKEQHDTIAPNASAMVGIYLETPTTVSSVGYRVRSLAGNFSDGEQSAIPVLGSEATVRESTEFYLNPSQKEPFRFNVAAPEDAELTLLYCQNPVWTIVKAMRGVYGQKATTSTQIVSHIFSSLAGKYIVEGNSDIAEAIALWKNNMQQQALTSMLQRNENLKNLLLDETPWVQAAKNETERMEMLAELLDSAKTSEVIENAVAELGKLQNKDGGFAWGTWSRESSEWATGTVLTTLGIAKSLGMYKPDESMRHAFEYLQSRSTEKPRSNVDISFSFIHVLYPEFALSDKGRALVDSTLDYIGKNWKKASVGEKAYYVLILKQEGRMDLAGKIMESIRQFAVESTGKGTSFPSVEDIREYATIIQAYVAMNAPSSEIDALRQWVIVRAQAMDDLGAWNPDYVVAAILLTGSPWTSVPVEQSVSVNGKAIDIDSVESNTGYFAQTIAAKGNVEISVKPNGQTPSYGAVIATYNQIAKDVKARPGKDLRIEKRLLVENKGSWIETDNVKLGQRVRVQLIITAKRDLEYVSIVDDRAAALEPVEQLPGYVYDGSLIFYRENLDASTRLFIGYLPKGTYHVVYDMTANNAGTYSAGIASLQSQYAPELTAHSGGYVLTVE